MTGTPLALASRMVDIRAYRPGDLDTLYDICLTTGDDGRDATHLYRDPKVIGHVYAGAYGVLSPETAFVVEDGEGAGGYIIGPADTNAFEKRCEAEWWPALRARYADPSGDRTRWTWDERMAHHIHHPDRAPRRINEIYPAHLHINLLPRFQGRGIGKRLIDRWLAEVGAMGASSACLRTGERNPRAVRFYRACGFHEVERFGDAEDGILFGIALPR
jgi:ribosomal protein S18 acetylase RimI-like enzyme